MGLKLLGSNSYNLFWFEVYIVFFLLLAQLWLISETVI